MAHNVYPVVARAGLPLLILSLVSNLAILISPLFMMQVLDRVIPSGNLATLALLGSLAIAALVLQGLVEAVRDVSLGRLARWSEREGTALALISNTSDQNTIIEHVVSFSRFLKGPAVIAALGAPWIPVFAFVIWSLHPAFLALLFAMSLLFWVSRTVSDALGRVPQQNVSHTMKLEDATLREIEIAARDVGIATLVRNLRVRFAELQRRRHSHMDEGELPSVSHSTFSSLIRNMGQISALAVGAWLVTIDQLSAGGMIAGSIISSKGYATIESLLVSIPAINEARQSHRALSNLPSEHVQRGPILVEPSGDLRAENLIYPRGGGAPPRLDRVSFNLQSGDCLAVVGSSGSGKSTLLRALFGSDTSPIGSVFLGDSEVRGLSGETISGLAGYVPQCAVLKTGTIAENISSFAQDPEPNDIFAASKTAGVHGLISALPNGYDTDIGNEPHILSLGQMQRIALARALYSRPKYVFLDEPNALLDAEGERAFGQALMRLKQQGTTIVMAVHRSGILGLADKVLHLDHGRVADFGPRADVLSRLGMGGRQIELPTLETSHSDLKDWIASQFTRDGDYAFRNKAQIVATELLKIACGNCPRDSLKFSSFAFKFIDSAECEISMIEREPSDIGAKLELVQSKLQKGQSNPIHFSKDEVRIAAITEISETFTITSGDDCTQYQVFLVADEDSIEIHRERYAI